MSVNKELVDFTSEANASTPLRIVRDSIATLGAMILWITFIQVLFTFLQSYNTGFYRPILDFGDSPGFLFLTACVLAPLSEELVYRIAPYKLCKAFKMPQGFTWIMMIVASMFFGWLHGSTINIAVQGVLGILFSWLYVRHQSYLANVAVHATYNFYVIKGFEILSNVS